MINLLQPDACGPAVQTVPSDPGRDWLKDPLCAVEAAPDNDGDPSPDAQWSAQAVRTGVCGVVAPRIIRLPGGFYRMYYTQILPRSGFPAGAADYANATARILSAVSTDCETWTMEPGVRLTARDGGAGEFRVGSSEVVPLLNGNGRLRMYYECSVGPLPVDTAIRSAISVDGGLVWTPEPGVRFGATNRGFATPRLQFIEDGSCRLYCGELGRGIVSARSDDGGQTFVEEPGVRIAADGPYDAATAYAPEILRVAGGAHVMYYAGYETGDRAHILRAESADGLNWRKDPWPVISPAAGWLDSAKCSEMCVATLPPAAGGRLRYRLYYEACDGTVANRRGVWRIVSATAGERAGDRIRNLP